MSNLGVKIMADGQTGRREGHSRFGGNVQRKFKSLWELQVHISGDEFTLQQKIS